MNRERRDGASLIKLVVLVFATPVVTAALVAAAMILTRRVTEPAPVIGLSRSAAVRPAPAAKKEAPSEPAVVVPVPDPTPEPGPDPDKPQPPAVPDEDDAMPEPADQPAADEPDPTPVAVAPVPEPVDPDPDPDPVAPEADVWMLDDFRPGEPHVWRTAAWENPATLRVEEGGLMIEMLGGARDKTAVGRVMNMDVSSRSHVVLDIRNDMRHTLSIAVAFIVGPNSAYYESVPVPVRPGSNENVAFDLRAATFKSATSQWQHQRPLGHASDVKSMYILIYTRGKGGLSLQNVRLFPGEPVLAGEAP